MSEFDDYMRGQSEKAELTRRLARDMKDRAEAARREERANRGKARAERQAQLLAKAELGYGSW